MSISQAFKPTKKVDTPLNEILIDDNEKQWYCKTKGPLAAKSNPQVFNFAEIIDFELVEDGNTITKGGTGMALAGGALFGAAGAIVGGTVGKKKSKTEVTTMQINVTLNHKYMTMVTIPFLNPIGGKSVGGSADYKLKKMQADKAIAELNRMCNSAVE